MPSRPSCREIHHHESQPASHDSQRRVGARKHERYKLVSIPKDQLVDERAVHDQRDADRYVQQRKSIQQKHTRPLRHWSHPVEYKEEQDQPEDGVNGLDRKFRRGEQEREQGHMPGHGKRAEGVEVATVFEGDETERDDDEEDRLLMHVPSEEERCISAQRHGSDKRVPVGSEPELGESGLVQLADCQCCVTRVTYQLKRSSQRERLFLGHFRQDSKGRVSNTTPSETCQSIVIHRKAQPRRNCDQVRRRTAYPT